MQYVVVYCVALRAAGIVVACVVQCTALQLTVTSVEAIVAVTQVVTVRLVLVVAAGASVHARHAVTRIPCT